MKDGFEKDQPSVSVEFDDGVDEWSKSGINSTN